jgi:signal transduction histidine kinase/integral membrane sensor domain MASE1
MTELAASAKRHSVQSEAFGAMLFALAYFAGGELGYALSLGPTVGGTFWPPAGISLAFFLASPRRAWPLLLVSGIVANYLSDMLHGQTLPAAIGFAIANLGEPLLGAALLQRVLGTVRFTRVIEVVALTLVVVFVSAPLASAIGAFTAEQFTQNPPGFAVSWRTWWVGDAVGALVLAPAVLRVITDWRRLLASPLQQWFEAVAYIVVLVAVTELVFSAPPVSLAMPFLVFPVILWGSLRCGPIGVGAGLCLVVLLTTHDTVAGLGPFGSEALSPGDQLIALQIYVGVMALSFYGMGLLWEERLRTAALLKSAHTGLEARYRRIVEQSPLAILAVERGGGVQEANPAWRQLWLARQKDSDGKPWQDPEFRPWLDRAFAGEVVELPEREIEAPAAGDEPRRVRGFAYPVKDELGQVREVVLIERDITHEVLAEQQRQQLLEAERFARGEAERALQLKDEFLATLSHELRTPLNAIVGWAHILRRTARDPALSQAVDTIERNAIAQAKLIDDLLDMSRIMAGKIGLTFTRFKLGSVVAAAADGLRPEADAKGVRLSIAGAPENDWLVGDATRIQQVVGNLLSNGVKFTPAGGRVNARTVVEGTEVKLVVADTGRGIPQEFLPAVFDRFRQADGSITRRHGGLGLGLSIAKHIVELHGGTISAESAGPDCGATFIVTWPRASEGASEVADARAELPSAFDLQGFSALVVDDEADARELLQRLMREHGCDVTVASSAAEALQALADRRYDLLLTDIGMPVMDGYELLRRMYADTAARPTAIAVTAFARAEDRDRALSVGFAGHLAKPVNPAQLLKLLARLVGARRA